MDKHHAEIYSLKAINSASEHPLAKNRKKPASLLEHRLFHGTEILQTLSYMMTPFTGKEDEEASSTGPYFLFLHYCTCLEDFTSGHSSLGRRVCWNQFWLMRVCKLLQFNVLR